MRKVFAFVVVVVAAATGKPEGPPQTSLAGLDCPVTASPSVRASNDACPAPAKMPDRSPGKMTQAKTS